MRKARGSRKFYLVTACLVLLVLVAALPGRTEEPRLYTNADLENLPGLDLPVSAPLPLHAEAVPEQQPAMALEAPRLESVSPLREEYRAFAELRVREARARVEELRYRLVAVENPFLPRPLLTAEEQRLWLHLDNVQRANYVDDQLADATAELMSAEASLARLRGDGVL